MFERDVERKLREGAHADDDQGVRHARRAPGKSRAIELDAASGEPGKQTPVAPMRPADAIRYGLAIGSSATRQPPGEGSLGDAFAFLADDGHKRRPPPRPVHRQAATVLDRKVSRDELEHLIAGSRGEALPAELRGRLERRLGDLDDVRIHVDAAAHAAARFLHAEAFALGDDIFFAEGKYDPSSLAGQRLIAHEVAHTAQHAESSGGGELDVSAPGDAHEQQADAFADAFAIPAPGDHAARLEAPVEHRGVARAPAPAAPFDAATMLKPVTASVKKAGTVERVEAVKDGDQVRVQTPGVAMEASVVLKDGVDPGPVPVKVGWVQTVVSSERIGNYFKDGVLARRDVTRFSSTRDGKAGVEAPWYETPLTMTKTTPDQYPIAEDQPKMAMAATLDGAKLTEIQGADTFKVSVEVGPDGNLTRLKSFQWTAPWSVVLDDNQGGKGGDVSVSQSDTHEAPSTNRPANEVGTDPANRVQTYESVAAATEGLGRLGIIAFLKEMPKHKRLAANSYWNMVGALWASSAKFHVRITPLGSSPKMPVKIAGASTIDFGEVETDNKEYTAIAHTVYDPGKLGPGDVIQIFFHGTSVAHLDWPYEKRTERDVKWDDDLFNIEAWLA